MQKQSSFDKVTLSQEQQEVFNKLETTNGHFFITGKAGTGKSLLLQYFRTYSQKKLVVLAPTGVAALNVGGQTIHSLLRLPFSAITLDSFRRLRVDTKLKKLLQSLDCIVIDEISMVRVDIMEAIDYILKKARNSYEPFGGVQMIMFGDLYQLPPVVTSGELQQYFDDTYGGAYCFNANSWRAAKPEIITLSKIFRQSDATFIDLLNSLRDGNPNEDFLDRLNQRASIAPPQDGAVTLATTNRTVSEINQRKLDSLRADAHEYEAEVSGKLEESAFPTDKVLQLKKGAQIMMLKNDRDKRWVNGSLGTIHSISPSNIKVNLDDIVYTVRPETWSKIKYTYDQRENKIKEEVISTFTQYPLRLAWAITIHKSQGQTYSNAIIDLGRGAFAHGQTYVALSRCVSLDSVYLSREVSSRDIIVDKSVIAFMKGL
ncbi:MAG: helicase [Candidatus Pacebacteria bacterium CG10_big_fil_rev_8_21_14_0_10_44_54]|nr:MAG: helicase [Candidatus Pacebacteria bacterium CG10_big_fil_rev_8_21_14_0_10_44_54]